MRTRLAIVLACVIGVVAAPPAPAAVREGPKGDAFYKPPKPLPGKRHGDLIWARVLPPRRGLDAASSTVLVLYRSKALGGSRTAVSGIVMLPRGRPPRGGWPIVTFGHGTAGIADECAPSRARLTSSDYGRSIIGPLWSGYLKAGYAVAQTDYEGLGTPGHHPFLIGRSEARGVLDIARAARDLDRRVGRRLLVAGHSQGGHAVLWAAGEAPNWTPELRLLGTQAFAPIGKASPLGAAREGLTARGGLAAYAGLITRAFDTVLPSFEVGDWFTQPALDLYPQTIERCIGDLFGEDSFGSISVADMFRDDADGDQIVGLLEQYVDLNQHKLRGPVLLIHGTADSTIPVVLSDALAEDLREAGTRVTYRKYEGAGHSDVVRRARRDALADARRRIR